MEAKILQYAKDSVEAEASPVANNGGFDAVAVPGATPSRAAGAAASLGGAAPAVVPPYTPQAGSSFLSESDMQRAMVLFGGQLNQLGGHLNQHMMTLATNTHQQLEASNAAQIAVNAAQDQRTAQVHQQQMAFQESVGKRFTQNEERMDQFHGTVQDLTKRIDDLEKQEYQKKSNKRVSFGTRNHVKLISPKKRKSILKDDQSTSIQPSTRSTRPRSAQESTPVSKRTTRSMSRQNEK